MAQPKRPSQREAALTWMRVAGYHNDRAAFTRLYIENKVSNAVAKEQFCKGQDMRAAGVPCTCSECKAPSLGAAVGVIGALGLGVALFSHVANRKAV